MFTALPPPLPTTYAQCRDHRPHQHRPDWYHDRNPQDLNPVFRGKVAMVLLGLQEQGYQPVILEGYRSPQRQDYLFARGSSIAHGCQSFHQYGLAVDIGFINPQGGELDLHETPYNLHAHQALGQVAQNLGLAWGGTYGDDGHIELRLPVFAHMDNVAVLKPYTWAVATTCQNTNYRYSKFTYQGI